MTLIPSVRFVTLTAGATVAALLIAPAISPNAGSRFGKAVLPEKTKAIGTKARTPDEISLAHGVIGGVLPASANAVQEAPGGVAWNRPSAFDREFKDLLDTLHKGANRGIVGRSLWRTVGDFLSRTPQDSLREETVLDPVFGEISVRLDSQLGRPHSAPSRGSESFAAANSTLRVVEANLLADMEKTAPASTVTEGPDYARAPIGVNTSSSDGGTLVISGQPLASGTWSDTNAGTAYVPPAPNWYGLPASAPLNGGYTAGSFGGGSLIVTAPAPLPPPAPNWSNFTPAPATGNWSSGEFHQKFATSTSTATVLSSAPAVVSLAPAIRSQTVTVPSSVGVSSATLTINSIAGSSAPASSGNFQPQIPQNTFIFVGDTAGNAVKEYNATSTGSPLLTINLPANSEEISVAVAGTALYVADFGAQTVTAYSIASGTLGQPLAGFTTITGLKPNAVTLSSNGLSLYVASGDGTSTGTVKEYNAVTGALISGGVFTPISAGWPYALTLSTDNTKIYVGDAGNQDGTAPTSVKEYNASNGALIGTFSLSGTVDNLFPGGLAMTASGQNLLVVNESADPAGNVQEYNATTGTQVAFSLSPGETDSDEPTNIVSFGNTMYISDEGQANVTEYTYTTSTGTQVSTGTFDITGVDPYGLAIIPEPSTGLLLLASGTMFLLRRRRVSVQA